MPHHLSNFPPKVKLSNPCWIVNFFIGIKRRLRLGIIARPVRRRLRPYNAVIIPRSQTKTDADKNAKFCKIHTKLLIKPPILSFRKFFRRVNIMAPNLCLREKKPSRCLPNITRNLAEKNASIRFLLCVENETTPAAVHLFGKIMSTTKV